MHATSELSFLLDVLKRLLINSVESLPVVGGDGAVFFELNERMPNTAKGHFVCQLIINLKNMGTFRAQFGHGQ